MANAARIFPLDEFDLNLLADHAVEGLFHETEAEVADRLLTAVCGELRKGTVCEFDAVGAILILFGEF